MIHVRMCSIYLYSLLIWNHSFEKTLLCTFKLYDPNRWKIFIRPLIEERNRIISSYFKQLMFTLEYGRRSTDRLFCIFTNVLDTRDVCNSKLPKIWLGSFLTGLVFSHWTNMAFMKVCQDFRPTADKIDLGVAPTSEDAFCMSDLPELFLNSPDYMKIRSRKPHFKIVSFSNHKWFERHWK